MQRKRNKTILSLIIGLPLISMVACSGGGSSSQLTDNLWKIDHMMKGGKKRKAPGDFYFDLRKGGELFFSRSPKDTMYWKKDGNKKVMIYQDKKKEKKRDTWTIKKMNKDTLKVNSSDEGGVMVMTSSDKKFKDVTS